MEASIDIGNTQIKVGIFDHEKLIMASVKSETELIDYLKLNAVAKLIVSSVGGKSNLIEELKHQFETLVLDTKTSIPIKISYSTPETLGLDRIAAVVGARYYHKAPILVIDAGSCITVDLIDEHNCFKGGSISPGIKMRLMAMHTFTESLPLLEVAIPGSTVPESTKEAMLSGAVIGAKHEIIGFITHFRKLYPDLSVILCGGDAKYFDNINELNIFVLPNLVLQGLNAILRFNGED